jgi:hypothetical protein
MWIALRRLPLYAWTDQGIKHAVSGFGTAHRILPYERAVNQYEEIYVHLVGEHPGRIPLEIKFQ